MTLFRQRDSIARVAEPDQCLCTGGTDDSASKLTVRLVPPQVEGNEIRMLNEVDLPQLRPMYEYLIGLEGNDAG